MLTRTAAVDNWRSQIVILRTAMGKLLVSVFAFTPALKTALLWYMHPDTWVDELKERDSALIYIRVYGSLGDIPENKWIFTINNFNSQ